MTPEELRALPYTEYLKTPWWKNRRLKAIQKAGGKCENCAGLRGKVTYLDVHHVYYNRLGAEQDRDLKVLCRPCHEEHHASESERHNIRLYVLLGTETLRIDHPATYAAFRDAFEHRCRQLNLAPDGRFEHALDLLARGKVYLFGRQRAEEVEQLQQAQADPKDPPHHEAVAILKRIYATFGFKGFLPIGTMHRVDKGVETGVFERRPESEMTA